MGKQIHCIPAKTMNAFKVYSWPGNIRELQNMVERAVILADDGVLPNPLPPSALQAITKIADPMTLKECERAFILQALEECHWVIGGPNGAAARLGIKRTTLYEQIKKVGIKRPSTRANIGESVGAGQQSEQLEQSDSSRPLFWSRGACA